MNFKLSPTSNLHPVEPQSRALMHFKPVLDIYRSGKQRTNMPRAGKALTDGLVKSIAEGYANRVMFGGNVGAAVRVMFAGPDVDVRAIAKPYAEAIDGTHVGGSRPQLPALFIKLNPENFTGDTLSAAILKALRAALPDEDFSKVGYISKRAASAREQASDLLDAYAVSCLVVRHEASQARASKRSAQRPGSGDPHERPSFLRLMSQASFMLNVSVLFVTQAKLEDPMELELAHAARVALLQKVEVPQIDDESKQAQIALQYPMSASAAVTPFGVHFRGLDYVPKKPVQRIHADATKRAYLKTTARFSEDSVAVIYVEDPKNKSTLVQMHLHPRYAALKEHSWNEWTVVRRRELLATREPLNRHSHPSTADFGLHDPKATLAAEKRLAQAIQSWVVNEEASAGADSKVSDWKPQVLYVDPAVNVARAAGRYSQCVDEGSGDIQIPALIVEVPSCKSDVRTFAGAILTGLNESLAGLMSYEEKLIGRTNADTLLSEALRAMCAHKVRVLMVKQLESEPGLHRLAQMASETCGVLVVVSTRPHSLSMASLRRSTFVGTAAGTHMVTRTPQALNDEVGQ